MTDTAAIPGCQVVYELQLPPKMPLRDSASHNLTSPESFCCSVSCSCFQQLGLAYHVAILCCHLDFVPCVSYQASYPALQHIIVTIFLQLSKVRNMSTENNIIKIIIPIIWSDTFPHRLYRSSSSEGLISDTLSMSGKETTVRDQNRRHMSQTSTCQHCELTLVNFLTLLPELGSCTKYGDSFTELFMKTSQSSVTVPVSSCWSTAITHTATHWLDSLTWTELSFLDYIQIVYLHNNPIWHNNIQTQQQST